jgi:hypothetical protein
MGIFTPSQLEDLGLSFIQTVEPVNGITINGELEGKCVGPYLPQIEQLSPNGGPGKRLRSGRRINSLPQPASQATVQLGRQTLDKLIADWKQNSKA